MSERRTPPSVFRKAGSFLGIAFIISLVLFSSMVTDAKAFTPTVGPPIAVNTSTANKLYAGFWGGSCTYLTFFYDFWVDSVTGVMYVSSSQNGVTWTAPATLMTLTPIGTSVVPQITCTGQTVVVVWTSTNSGASPGIGTTGYMYAATGAMGGGTVLMNSAVQGPKSNFGTFIKWPDASALLWGCVNYLNGIVFYCVNDIGPATNNNAIVSNAVVTSNLTSGYNGGGALTNQYIQFNNQGTYLLWWDTSGQDCKYAMSADGVTWGSVNTISATYCNNAGQFQPTVTTYNGNFYIPTYVATPLDYVVTIAPTGQVVGTPVNIGSTSWANAYIGITTDQVGDFAVIQIVAGSVQYYTSTNAGASYSSATSFSLGGAVSATGIALEPVFSSGLGAFAVGSSTTIATFNTFVVVFGIANSGGSTSVTIGQCPTKNTATTPLTNNTVIGYTGLTLQSEQLNTITTEVASVNSGHAASETLYMVVYEAGAVGSISAGNPALLVGFKTWVLTATSAPQQLSWAPNINLGSVGAGVTFMVGLYGNSKILINQSSLSGMSTATGTASTPPVSVTAFTSSGTDLFLCGTASFQNVFTVTSTSTTTSTVTSGGTATTTTTSTTVLTSLNSNAALGNSVGIAFVLLILLAPAFAIAVPIGVYTKSPIGVGLGFVAGLAIGALLGNQGGLIPFSVLAGMMVVIVLLIVGFLFALRSGQG